MEVYDLCLAWNWEYDDAFAGIMANTCRNKGLTLLQIRPDNLNENICALHNQQINFRAFFDRASEADSKFMPFVHWVREHNIFSINRYEKASRACDKALMHPDLIHNGLYVPYTIILPSFQEMPYLSPADLTPLGESFTIKPAHGSGGDGVMTRATDWAHVLQKRQEHPEDKYLLQAHITPRKLDGRPAWFRVIYCSGKIYPYWWHTRNSVYIPVTRDEQNCYGLSSLHEAASVIARFSGLDLFSTEIAFTEDGLFVVIDYVNDPIDLRPRSKAVDGVPDEIVEDIANRLVELAIARIQFIKI